MALTPEETQIAQYGKDQGKTKEQVLAAVAKYRRDQVQPAEEGYSLKEAGGDIAETAKGMWGSMDEAGTSIYNRFTEAPDDTVRQRVGTLVGAGGDLFRGIGGTIGNFFTGAGKLALPQSAEDKVEEVVTDTVQAVAETETAQDIMAAYQDLDPETREQVDNALGYIEGITSMVAPGQAKNIVSAIVRGAATKGRGAVSGVTGGLMNRTRQATQPTAAEALAQAARPAAQAATPPTVTPQVPQGGAATFGAGAVETAKDFGSRFPRLVERINEGAQEAASRGQRIREATPEVQNAIRAGVDQRVVNTINQADDATRNAYREMVDIADDAGDTLKVQERPEIIAGKAAEQQFNAIEKRRREIGRQIGETVNSLPDANVDMRPSLGQLRTVLGDNGIRVTNKGLDFSGSDLSRAQQNAVKELYEMATRGGETMNAKRVHAKDSAFSALQREKRLDKVSDIYLDVNGEPTNIFGLFRDVYRNQLDNLSPEMRKLNNEYRIYRQFVDDLENSIFKSGNFESVKNVSGSEFAQTNLRRIMSDAQSAAAYRDMVRRMDELARTNGYQGANPEDLIAFATELRKVYPDSVPSTSATGIFGGGVRGIAEKALGAGAPNLTDQQKALKAMLQAQKQADTPQVPAKRQDVPSVNDTAKLDKKIEMELTKERGAVGAPSDEWLVKAAQRQLKKTTNREKRLELEGYISRKTGRVTRQLPPENKQEIVEMIDYIRAGEKYDAKMQQMIDRYAKKYGLDANAKNIDEQLEDLLNLTETRPLPGTSR